MHEFGHGIYEYGGDRAARTPLARGTSLGFHESQSRMWENLVGRSRPFWQHYYPLVQEAFPSQMNGVDAEGFYRGVNRVAVLIRIDADEATYNLHIILRFELEQEMITGRLSAADVPEAWDAKMLEYLGVEVPDVADGALQDTHWAGGSIGYSTYALGTSCLRSSGQRISDEILDVYEQIGRGEFGQLREWLREHVHQHGRKYMPKELLERVVGSKMDPKPPRIPSGQAGRDLRARFVDFPNGCGADRPFRIAHISDVHCGGPYFVPTLLERAIAEINDWQPDLVVCCGDLTTFGYKPEFAEARAFLDRIECEAFVVIPGNHDSRNVGYVHFEEFFGDRNSVLQVGAVIVVAVDSTEPDLDHGRIGRGRYEWIEEQFSTGQSCACSSSTTTCCRCRARSRAEHRLRRGGRHRVPAALGVDLVLSGHKHVPYAWRLGHVHRQHGTCPRCAVATRGPVTTSSRSTASTSRCAAATVPREELMIRFSTRRSTT